MKKTIFQVTLIALVTALGLGFNSCANLIDFQKLQNGGSSSTVGNPNNIQMDVTIASYDDQMTIEMCVEGVVATTNSGLFTPTNVGILRTITRTFQVDTFIATVSIPADTYSFVDLQATNSCGTQFSVRVTNRNGTYTLTQDTTARFAGSISVSSTGGRIIGLRLEDILTRLNWATSVADVEAAFALTGTLEIK